MEGAKPEKRKKKKKKRTRAEADAQLNLPPIIDPSRASQNLILDANQDSDNEQHTASKLRPEAGEN